jgi:hypothetical protein
MNGLFDRFSDLYIHIHSAAPAVSLLLDDDATFQTMLLNICKLASFAKKMGCRGLSFDLLDGNRAFDSSTIPADTSYSVARKRGFQFMQAIQDGYKGARLFFLEFYSTLLWPPNKKSWIQNPLVGGDRLGRPFLDGMLDCADEEVFIDGFENAYAFPTHLSVSRSPWDTDAPTAALDFLNATDFIKNQVPAARSSDNTTFLVSPELHDKYKSKVKVGFAVLLDHYGVQDPKQGLDQSPLDFEVLVRTAMSIADPEGIVWFYSNNGNRYFWNINTDDAGNPISVQFGSDLDLRYVQAAQRVLNYAHGGSSMTGWDDYKTDDVPIQIQPTGPGVLPLTSQWIRIWQPGGGVYIVNVAYESAREGSANGVVYDYRASMLLPVAVKTHSDNVYPITVNDNALGSGNVVFHFRLSNNTGYMAPELQMQVVGEQNGVRPQIIVVYNKICD